MTLLRTGFFFSKSTWVPPVINAAPTITTVTLNFDQVFNVAPVGSNLVLLFDVIEGNAAPSITTATLNFDFVANSRPLGQNQVFNFEVPEPATNNAAPLGQNQILEFEVTGVDSASIAHGFSPTAPPPE